MLNHWRPMWALFLCLLLAACGGGHSAETLSQVSNYVFSTLTGETQSVGTGNPYDPMVPGTAKSFGVYSVKTILNAADQSLSFETATSITPATPTYLGLNTFAYSIQHCADFEAAPLFQWTYSNYVEDAVMTSPSGVQYIGEVLNVFAEVFPGEALMTMKPVEGEVIDAYSTLRAGCGGAVTSTSYHWRYKTIEHLATWNGFTDVWHTGLIEYNNDGSIYAAYNYWFARGVGMAALVWNNPSAAMTSGSDVAPGDNGLYYVLAE